MWNENSSWFNKKTKFLLITKKYTMKKLLLSSVIMLGVCGIATAQTDAKAQSAQKNTFSTAPTPQKSAIPASDAAVAQTDQGTTAPVVAAKKAPLTKAEVVAASFNNNNALSPDQEAALRKEKLAKANQATAPTTGKKHN